jgi:hypothetical protein
VAKRSIRSEMHRTARVMGDIQVAAKGPTAYGKRVMRKSIYRNSNSLTRQLLRMVGLQTRRRRGPYVDASP